MKKTIILSIALTVGNVLYSQSEESLRSALKTNPESMQTNHDLGVWLVNNNRSAEAVAYLHKAVQSDSTESSVLVNDLAASFEYSGSIDSAMHYYRQSGLLYTKHDEKYRNSGWLSLLYVAKQADDPRYYTEAFESLAALNPTWYGSGEVLNYNIYKELRDNPNSADAYIKLGDKKTEKLQFNEKWDDYMARYEKGVIAYEKAVKLDPSKKKLVDGKLAQVIKEIGNAYFEDGVYDTALEKYQQALKYSQRDPEVYSAIGFIKLEKLSPADYKGALVNFQKALALTTSSMQKKDHLENIGLCYEKQKDYANAIIYYDKGVAMEPSFAKTLHYKLARVYEAQGNVEKAKHHRRLAS